MRPITQPEMGRGTAAKPVPPENETTAQSVAPAATHCNAADDAKRLATLQARLALRGFALEVIPRGTAPTLYVARRWNQSHTFSHLDDVAALLRQLEGDTR